MDYKIRSLTILLVTFLLTKLIKVIRIVGLLPFGQVSSSLGLRRELWLEYLLICGDLSLWLVTLALGLSVTKISVAWPVRTLVLFRTIKNWVAAGTEIQCWLVANLTKKLLFGRSFSKLTKTLRTLRGLLELVGGINHFSGKKQLFLISVTIRYLLGFQKFFSTKNPRKRFYKNIKSQKSFIPQF